MEYTRALYMGTGRYSGTLPGERCWGSKPLHLEVKAMLLMATNVRELSNDNFHSGLNQ